MRASWETALATKDMEKIKEVLATGYIPDDLHALITIKGFFVGEADRQYSIVDILLRSNKLAQDADYFKIADKLIQCGAQLPQPYKNRGNFSNNAEYLRHLSDSDRDLFIVLRTNPDIINLRDENNQTLLHHVARVGIARGSNSAWLIQCQVFPIATFNVVDNNGDTPLHVAASCSHEKTTLQHILRNFVREATKHPFNFERKNNRGHTFIDITRMMAPQSGRIRDINQYIATIRTIMDNPIAEVRKNARVILGPKKTGKHGTLSVLPFELLAEIISMTSHVGFHTRFTIRERIQFLQQYTPRVNNNGNAALLMGMMSFFYWMATTQMPPRHEANGTTSQRFLTGSATGNAAVGTAADAHSGTHHVIGDLFFKIQTFSMGMDSVTHTLCLVLDGREQNHIGLSRNHIELIMENIGNINELKNIFTRVITGVTATAILSNIVEAERRVNQSAHSL